MSTAELFVPRFFVQMPPDKACTTRKHPNVATCTSIVLVGGSEADTHQLADVWWMLPADPYHTEEALPVPGTSRSTPAVFTATGDCLSAKSFASYKTNWKPHILCAAIGSMYLTHTSPSRYVSPHCVSLTYPAPAPSCNSRQARRWSCRRQKRQKQDVRLRSV